MSVAIQVSSELKQRLQQKAEQAGLNIERFLAQLIDDKNKQPQSKDAEKEIFLLEKINTGFSSEFWDKYNQLVDKRKAATLTISEHSELLKYSDKIEAANAQRIKYLIQLAQIKQIDLDVLMKNLGIGPANHA